MIEKLDLAGYFLIVYDVVRFCLENRILVQGRGSAANSAVCYALSITAIDPVKMELLFERFLSEERGEWPDIDLDLPSGDQRERVIQHVYEKYGPHGAGMTANVITYRDRSSAREVAKALGYSPEQVDALSKQLGGWNFGEIRDPPEELKGELAAAGLDPEERRARHFLRLFLQIQNLPRHLGQHSGGIVVAAGRLDEVVPLEPASMPGRVVVQWDKDDCADLGIVKVDLLGLGMLAAIEECIPMIRTHERVEVDLAHLPQDDPAVYRMLNAADTVGLFQVESRAQMASLPRNAPRCFYDIVVQVAIIRPGPIVGGMVRPFFERRQGRAPVEYPRSLSRADPEAHARRAALPGADPEDGDGGGRVHGRRSRGAAAGDGIQALGRADGLDREAAARRAWPRAASVPRRAIRSSSPSRRSRSTAFPSPTPRASR